MTRPLAIPGALLMLTKEALRILIRRPVVGVAAAARTRDGRWVLIQRGDTGQWALPGGTLEWGETLKEGLTRELREEAGVEVEQMGDVSGVYSRPDRDPRVHAVTIVVRATVTEPRSAPMNPLEIRDVRLFDDGDLPGNLGMGSDDMIRDSRLQGTTWE